MIILFCKFLHLFTSSACYIKQIIHKMEMHFTLSFMFFLLKTVTLEKLKHVPAEQQDIGASVSNNYVDEKEKDFSSAAMTVSDEKGGLLPETLSKLHNLAKDISHAKGIYREKEKEDMSDDDLQIRRSVLRKIAVESESDVMNNILKSFDTVEDKLHLLEQMEFLVHQYDVAINFANQGGVKVIASHLFSSDDKIVSSVASVLGAAMQSNPTVQKVAMESKVGEHFLKLLSHKSPVVLARILFALSCLLRNSPEAQEAFILLEGVSKLAEVLKNDQISTNSKLKVINLFSDLAVEQQTAQLYPNDRDSKNIMKLEKLFAIEMQSWKICKLIPSFLDLEDFDTHQKIVAAMTSVHHSCHKDFQNEHINNRLKKLLKIYDPDLDDQGPIYPLIDKDLKKALHSDLSTLLKETDEEPSNKSTLGLGKTEL